MLEEREDDDGGGGKPRHPMCLETNVCLYGRVASELRCGSRWRGERAGDGGKAIDDVGLKAKLKGKGERPSERGRDGER